MNSDYRRLGYASRCFNCFGSGNDLEVEETLDIVDLVKGLNICLKGIEYKMYENRKLAKQYTLNNEMSKAKSNLKIYHFQKQNHEQLLAIYTKACIIKEASLMSERMIAVKNTFQKEAKKYSNVKIRKDEIKGLMQEWDVIFENISDPAKMQESSIPETDMEKELEELKHINLSLNMPSVPVEKKSKEKSSVLV